MTTNAPDAGVLAFYGALASTYDQEFLVPHRRTYDRIAWEIVTSLFDGRSQPLRVVDIGCGTGRWARLLVAAGHEVIGIEPSAEMAAVTCQLAADQFRLLRCGVDDADIDPGWADLVIAMGSIQYAPDPCASIARAAQWLAPDGVMAVLVDSLGGLVLELLARGDREQAIERATSRRAHWERNGFAVGYHLFDAGGLGAALRDAGLCAVEVYGLLVSAAVLDREQLGFVDPRDLAVERELAAIRPLANSAKQLLAIGRKGMPP